MLSGTASPSHPAYETSAHCSIRWWFSFFLDSLRYLIGIGCTCLREYKVQKSNIDDMMGKICSMLTSCKTNPFYLNILRNDINWETYEEELFHLVVEFCPRILSLSPAIVTWKNSHYQVGSRILIRFTSGWGLPWAWQVISTRTPSSTNSSVPWIIATSATTHWWISSSNCPLKSLSQF